MKIAKLLPAAALLILPLAAPITAYAADTGSSSAATTTATTQPVTTANGLYVSGDVVLSGVCQVEGQYRPGQMMVFRAQVLETNSSATLDPKTTTVNVNVAGQSIQMQFHGDMWVGTYMIPLTQKPGFLPYTISAQDGSGNKGTFVPLGMPPAVVNGNVDINVNGVKVGAFTEVYSNVSLYPIIQMLKKSGLDVKWNGKTLSVNSPLIPTASLRPATGQGPYSIVVNGKTVFNTTGTVMKDAYTHKDTTYLSADVIGFLLDFLGHGNPEAASFTGYEFDFNPAAAASTSAPASTSSSN